MELPDFLSDAEIEYLKTAVPRSRSLYDLTTRMIDIALSLGLLILLIPLMLVVAILIKLADGGPVFYQQKRLGKHGLPFYIYKFRSMKVNAELEGARLQMVKDDPRVTRIGKFLREFHIDEIPQLWNVLCAQMSLVGPRPALTFHKDYYAPWEMARLEMAPGMTGLSQVYGGNALNWDARIVMDVYYVHHRNLILYFKILWMTFIQLFYKKGIYSRTGTVKGWTRPVPEWYEQGLPEPEPHPRGDGKYV